MRRLDALHTERDGRAILASPLVGACEDHVRDGQIVGPGEVVATVTRLHSRTQLVVPAGVHGRVRLGAARRRGRAVGYGDELVALEPVVGGAAEEGPQDPVAEVGEVFTAPMDGMFYRRSGPDAAPFVTEDAIIEPGAQIGLIEVMKFFDPIRWEGEGPRRVVRCVAADGAAVVAGAALVVLARV